MPYFVSSALDDDVTAFMHISSTFPSSQIPASTSPHDHQLQQTQLDEGLKANLLLIINVLTQFLAPIILPFFSADSNLEKFQCEVNLDPNFEQALNTLQIALGIIPNEKARRRLHNKNSTKKKGSELWEVRNFLQYRSRCFLNFGRYVQCSIYVMSVWKLTLSSLEGLVKDAKVKSYLAFDPNYGCCAIEIRSDRKVQLQLDSSCSWKQQQCDRHDRQQQQ